MGSEPWGSEGDWGGDQSWGGDSWGGQTSYEGPGYLRSHAMLSEAPSIVVNNSSTAFNDDNMFSVPILDLVFKSKRKLRNKTKTVK